MSKKFTKPQRALAHEILAYWLRFNKHKQDVWVGDVYGGELVSTAKVGDSEVNVCNTSMCAAGTAVFLTTSVKDFKSAVSEYNFSQWRNAGGEVLGLTKDEAEKVFLSNNKSAKRFMRAIADGSEKAWDKAFEKSISMDEEALLDEEDY